MSMLSTSSLALLIFPVEQLMLIASASILWKLFGSARVPMIFEILL